MTAGYSVYGVSVERLLGGTLPLGYIKSEWIREVSDALSMHPNIKAITEVTVTVDGSRMSGAMIVESTDGSTQSVGV